MHFHQTKDGTFGNDASIQKVTAVIEQQIEEFTSLRQSMREGKITMVEIAPCSFLCLVRGRMKTSPIFIGDHLFIFMPNEVPTTNLSRYISKLFLDLPTSCQRHLSLAINQGRQRVENPTILLSETI